MPLLWLSVAFVVGLIFGRLFQAPDSVLMAGFLLFGFLGWFEWRFGRTLKLEKQWRRISPLPLAAVIAAILFGAWRYPVAKAWQPPDLAFYNDSSEITIVAKIINMPEEGDRTTRFFVQAESGISEDGNSKELVGKALVEVPNSQTWKYGDRIRISGLVETPPENETFSYREYLSHQGVNTLFSYPYVELLTSNTGNPVLAALYTYRQHADKVIGQILPQPESALLSGILLGLENNIPADVEAAFRETGTAHIIAISGFNIAVVAAFAFWIFRKIALRWNAALLTIAVLFLYSVFVGWQPSVVRAAIMGSMAILGSLIGRRGAGLNMLAFTAAVMCAFDPYLPWNVSFQLSFTATLGLILLGDPLQRGFSIWLESRISKENAKKIAQWVGEYLLLTIAAQIATLPVIAFQFQRISLTALVANPLILPAQPLLMVLGAIAVFLASIFLPAGRLLAFLVLPLASYTIRVVELLAELPGELLIGSLPPWLIVGVYLLVFAWLGFREKLKQHVTPSAVLIGAGLVTVVLWKGALARPDATLHLVLPGLENSNAIILKTPGGKSILLNGAASSSQLTSAIEQQLSIFDRELDAVFITDPKATTISGLVSVAETLPIHQSLWGSGVPSSRTARRLESNMRSSGVKSKLLVEGQKFQIDEKVFLEVIKDSPDGTALAISFSNFTALIPGGIAPSDLMDQPSLRPGVTVVILTTLDQEGISSDNWAAFKPMAVIFNDLGQLAPVPGWLNSSEHGTIEVISDGVWVNYLGSE